MLENPPFLFRDVEGETLLLVEGIEDARFFSAILHRLKRDNVQIARVGGRNNFRPFLTSVLSKSENFSRLRRLGIVRDADISAESTSGQVVASERLPAGETIPPHHYFAARCAGHRFPTQFDRACCRLYGQRRRGQLLWLHFQRFLP